MRDVVTTLLDLFGLLSLVIAACVVSPVLGLTVFGASCLVVSRAVDR